MRSTPKWNEVLQYPVIAGTSILAIATTIAWWSKVDVSPLFETAMIRRGELWRLLTSIFLHSDILHLSFNIYWLWILGTTVERVYGHFRTAAFIILFALGSGSLEFAFERGGVGLSGVGYGLFGLLWVLSRYDERFFDAMDRKTIQLFVLWFVFCIAMTVTNIFSVGNVAHGAGAVLGALTAATIALPSRRTFALTSVAVLFLFGLWGATFGRPRINFSKTGGYEEGKWGYDALTQNRNQDAVRWLRDAVIYQPKLPVYWYDLGIAYQRLGNVTAAKASYQKAVQLDPHTAEYSDALKGLN